MAHTKRFRSYSLANFPIALTPSLTCAMVVNPNEWEEDSSVISYRFHSESTAKTLKQVVELLSTISFDIQMASDEIELQTEANKRWKGELQETIYSKVWNDPRKKDMEGNIYTMQETMEDIVSMLKKFQKTFS